MKLDTLTFQVALHLKGRKEKKSFNPRLQTVVEIY